MDLCGCAVRIVGGEMKIIRLIGKGRGEVGEKMLRHCGLLKEAAARPPPVESRVAELEPGHEYGYFERVCI